VSHIIATYGSSGPILDFYIGVSAPRRSALIAAGGEVPPPVRLPFIIDTGAETTLINDQHMRTLGILPRGQKQLLTATSDVAATSCYTYDVSISTVTYGDDQLNIPAIEVIGRPFLNHSIEGLIGRDILSLLTFQIDGRNKRFRIDY